MTTQLEQLKKKIEKLPNRFREDFSTRTHDYEQGYKSALRDILAIMEEEDK